MSEITLLDADQVAPEVLHAAFRDAFADYLAGPFELPLAQWPAFLARQGVDLRASRTAWRAGRLFAFALVARRDGARWRLATMGAVPAARGGGAAPRLLDELIGRAAAAGVAQLELEVFAQNERAARLYRGRGFAERHALRGWVKDVPADAAPAAPPAAVARDDALAWLRDAESALPDLPLQVCAPVLAAATTPWTAWRRGRAQLCFAAAGPALVNVTSLIDRDPAQADARALLAALQARHPGHTLKVPPLQRDDVGGDALRAAGFAPLPLHQLWMVRPVAQPSPAA